MFTGFPIDVACDTLDGRKVHTQHLISSRARLVHLFRIPLLPPLIRPKFIDFFCMSSLPFDPEQNIHPSSWRGGESTYRPLQLLQSSRFSYATTTHETDGTINMTSFLSRVVVSRVVCIAPLVIACGTGGGGTGGGGTGESSQNVQKVSPASLIASICSRFEAGPGIFLKPDPNCVHIGTCGVSCRKTQDELMACDRLSQCLMLTGTELADSSEGHAIAEICGREAGPGIALAPHPDCVTAACGRACTLADAPRTHAVCDRQHQCLALP